MQIYNTLSRRKEEFVTPTEPIRLYVCGITPYDTTHIGHAFTYVAFDVLVRYLESVGHTIRYVQNVTDVDDDILRRAEKLGIAWHELAREQTAHYLEDMASLNMSLKYLGETLDIHGGGEDLIFPHHESEIAQSEHYTCKHPFSRFWMHTGMVRLGGEKMSKSLGNLVLVSEVLSRYSGDALRLHLEGFHYRESWDYEEDGLERAESLAAEVRDALEGWRENGIEPETVAHASDCFLAAMENDLDTPRAIEALRELTREISTRKRLSQKVQDLQTALAEMVRILGLSIVK